MNNDMAKAIAKWWADFLREGKRNDAHLAEFEAQSPKPGVLTYLMDIFQDSRMIDPEHPGKVDTFERELTKLLLEGPDEKTHLYGIHAYPKCFYLDVDYDPRNFLARALELAGLCGGSASGLPFKTIMTVTMTKASVRMQGKDPVVVWSDDVPDTVRTGEQHGD